MASLIRAAAGLSSEQWACVLIAFADGMTWPEQRIRSRAAERGITWQGREETVAALIASAIR